mmetsp:Transcript_4276/g.8218  ORF Transcript_4276/g.8218 Transcript_4276/m.8218 type:complete len:3387 (-) Transcript_4276:172-10332(-)
MAKKAILEVLESTIGKYVLNLDAESLNVGVWAGKVELQSLQLDVNAVNAELSRRAHEAPNLASPFRVCEGRFEKVQMDVPWARLSSRPVVFRARGLWVYMEPHDFLKDDSLASSSSMHVENRYGTRVRAKKKKDATRTTTTTKLRVVEERANSIGRAEAARKRANAVRGVWEEDDDGEGDNGSGHRDESKEEDGKSDSFTSRLVRRIIENLQVEVEDVHVAVRGCGCAAGLVLGSLSLVTTDARGNRTFVDRKTNAKDPASSFLYKELLISGLGIYLQDDTDSQDSIQRRMLKVTEKAEYVLSPLSFQAKLRQSDLDHCVSFPKYLVHSKLSSLSISLSRSQLELGQRLALAVAPSTEIRPLFPEYRPSDPIAGNAKRWWRYAVRCIGRLNRHRSWIEFMAAFRKRKSYVELYKRHAHAKNAPWLATLSSSERDALEEIESDRSVSVSGLMHWRTIADAQAGKEREKARSKRKESAGAMAGGGSGNHGQHGVVTPAKSKSSIKSSFASSLFGTPTKKESLSKRESSADSFYECLDEENDAPIALTPDEMKELEELAIKKADKSLTEDSMFCDVNFNLGSFQVNLLTAQNAPLTSLEMGMVSASFKANADGSFTSGLSLLSLEAMDSVTPRTFYPTICRSLQKEGESNKSHAFEFQLRKSKGGDQELVLKMVACEIVASPMLLFAVKEFFKLDEEAAARRNDGAGNAVGNMGNPTFYESSSGDQDLFFDANEGMSAMLLSPLGAATAKSQFDYSSPTKAAAAASHASTPHKDGKVSDKLSSAILDAWKGKNQQKQQWKMDFDISAPILILPENCTDPNATVLICNFGRFNFTYGTEALSPAMLEWFEARLRAHRMDSGIDHLKLEMNDLSFTVSSVGEASKNRMLDEMDSDASASVIEPISFTLDIGLEHTISSSGDDTPRTCVVGVLPGIVLRLAPSHVTKILRVAAIWASNLHNLRGEPATEDGGPTILSGVDEEESYHDLEIISSGSGVSILDRDAPETPTAAGGGESLLSKKNRLESMLLSRQTSDGSQVVEFMHVSVSLLRLSINMYTDNGDGLEAHLVSVVASTSLMTDGTSSTNLSMGWFWILDRLASASEQHLPRRQRLVCHSNLPKAATEYAENDQYATIMNDLQLQGVFKPNYAGSADLADINIIKLPASKARAYHEQTQDFSRGYMQSVSHADKTTVVNAKFTSLFVNWNPHAIKTLFAAKSNVLDFKEKAYSTYESMSMLNQQDNQPDNKQIEVPTAAIDVTSESHSIFILAEMESFEISLNSAKDDLPLFTLTMSGSKVNHHGLEGDDANSEMSLVVGDFRMVSTAYGRTLESYRTILGLAPSSSTSLLTVKYSKGTNAVRSCNVGGADKLECEACAEIVLSPMRFVHIHSQVFTLIEYVTEGVFGAIAASVASSAAAAAMEVAKSSQTGERLFYIVASGSNLVVPQAAYSEKHFSFHSGNFEAHYRAFEGDVGSEAQVSLMDVSMNCSQNMQMVSAPVNMSVSVKLKPPFTQITEDERATKVEMSISRIRLLVARCHYAQMMHTIDYNIGEQDNFLREEKAHAVKDNTKEEKPTGATVNSIIKNLTHAGVENVEVVKRMYINFNIQELSVELCGDTTDDPIMSLAAVKAHILMKLLPDEKQTKAYVTMHDLVCDDRRVGSVDHTFRRMVGRANVNRMKSSIRARDEENESEVFLLNYTKYAEDDSRDIEVKIGSSQVVVLPDVISDMLKFIKVAPYPYERAESSRSSSALSEQPDETSMQVVVTDDEPEEVETCFESVTQGQLPTLKKTNYQIESSNMRLVLVDLGSIDSSGPFVSTKRASALTETIVLQGKMKANFQMTSDSKSDVTLEKDYKIDAERVEIYTAQGAQLLHPVQVLEPAKFAIFYYQNENVGVSSHLTDLKFVTLSPIDLTVSMQNAALASTLASSITDSFSSDKDGNDDEDEFHSLTATDASRIARLDSALMKEPDESTQSCSSSEHRSQISVHAGKQQKSRRRTIRVKMTSPEATLTVTNDFQGLDEALFKIVAMNCVFGGEMNYPGIFAHEKPCFGCNMNTSILADYFDAASNRWETLLTSPWELTFNASRSPQTRQQSKRMSTTFDIESSSCHVSFSEHFLVNVGAASRMWSVYSGATKQATALVEKSAKDDSSKRRLSRSMAAHAARSLITTLPYAIENHSGISASYSIYDNPIRYPLPTSSTQFFRFELFPGRGSGGQRVYGQDSKHSKTITLYVGNTKVTIQDMDQEVSKPRSAHFIADIRAHVFVNVVKSGNSTVLHISSIIEMHNSSSLPFRIAVIGDDCVHDLGLVKKSLKRNNTVRDGSKSLLKESEDLMTHSVFGLPAPLLRSFTLDTSETLCIQISPVLEDSNSIMGMFNLPAMERLVEIATSDERKEIIEVACSPVTRGNRSSSLAANICCKVSLVDGAHPFVELFIEPRVILKNKLPVSIILRTPMPHTFFSSDKPQLDHAPDESDELEDPNYTTHRLMPLESVEVFTPGPSIAASIKCADLPIGGTSTGWADFLDLPLKSKIIEPLNCTFPFMTKSLDRYESSRQIANRSGGSDFYVLDADDVTPDLKGTGEINNINPAVRVGARTFVFIVCNYAVDHTGTLLFEKVFWKHNNASRRDMRSINSEMLGSPPYSAFSSTHHRRRVSLLPEQSDHIRLVKLTMDGESGMVRSVPFRLEDCSMTEGIDSMPILWGDATPSGYFAYRHLTAEGSELHIVPEFVIFNGSEHHQISVKQLGGNPRFLLEPSKISPISRDRNNSIVVQFEVPAINGVTGPVQIDKVGLRICVVKSVVTGEPLGSLAVQTVTGARDSRLVIKIGALNFRESENDADRSSGLFTHDFIRFRVRWSEMRVTLRDTEEENEKYEENRTAIRKYLEHHNVESVELEKKLAEARHEYNVEAGKKKKSFPEVAQILLHRFTVDFQRIFKEDDPKVKDTGLPSSERAQFSVVVHNVRITDCSPNTQSSIVFDSMSDNSFFDLCVRTRGPLNADLIRVDLFDLNLAYGNGKAEKIIVNTGEDFVWRLLDIANRTMLATADLAGVDLDLKWNNETGKFSVAISDPRLRNADDLDLDGNYNPPRSDKLYDVKKLRVSPFILLLSFKRQPQSSRYQLIRGVRGAKLTNYFTTRLKFTIDRADLRFQGYMVRDIKGPPDRLADTIKAVYTTQLKSKMVILMTATSVQDWKYLTARDSGGEEFIEGDLLRATGNLAGRSAKFVLKKSGDYIGDGLIAVTGTIGGGIQDATESVGLGQVGAGVNSVVSGLGEGVSSGVKGVGTGAGDILRGAGKGIGQVVGGLGGGVQIVGKGIAKGVTTGDGKHLVSEVGTGIATMGSGLGQGVETALEGTVSGVFSVGRGLFSGAKSVGRGLDGVFAEPDESEQKPPSRERRRRGF